MDAPQAVADLTEISSQVVDVAIIDADGSILATTAEDAARAERLVAGIAKLLEEADTLREVRGLPDLAQLEVATLEGSVFAVRRHGRTIAATTLPDPTVGLVFYDLKHCLRSIEDDSALGAGGTHEKGAAGDTGFGREPGVGEPGVGDPRVDEPRVDEPRVDQPQVDGPRVAQPGANDELRRLTDASA